MWAAFLVSLTFGLHHSASSQLTVKETHSESFPEYVLDVHVRQPDRLDASTWTLRQGTQVLDAKLDSAFRPVLPAGCDYLFLIENAPFAEWDSQLSFFQQLISSGLADGLQKDDRVFIAHFDWKTGTNPTLIWVNDSGLSDAGNIIAAINGISRPSTTGRLHRTTELFPAIAEGLQYLNEKRRDDFPAAVVLFSREVQNIYNASPSESDLAAQSKSLDIPIYSVGYPPAEPFMKYVDKVINLTEKSLGKRIAIDDTSSPSAYAGDFSNLLKEVPLRASGWNYRWVLRTSAKAGNGTLAIEILAANEHTAVALPVPTYIDWLWNDPVRRRNLIIVLVVFFLIFGFTVFLIRRSSKKRKMAQEAKRKAEVDELRGQSVKVEEQLKSERERQQLERKEAEEAKEQQEKENRLHERQVSFRKLINHPLLIGSDGANHAVKQIDLVIGRSESAEIMILDDSVSRKHATISFGSVLQSGKGGGDQNFYISDLNSANGTIVNGIVIEPGHAHRLADNDLIVLGNITLIFRL